MLHELIDALRYRGYLISKQPAAEIAKNPLHHGQRLQLSRREPQPW
jgi:hypothetical protein